MTERGMIFNGEMVRAILDGSKTQTRRVMKPQPANDIERGTFPNAEAYGWVSSLKHKFGSATAHFCPFGKPGDRIWVRETWTHDSIDAENGSYSPDYRATANGQPLDGRWTPSIHMPRWASRITLEITNVGVQRLQSISQNDAVREGLVRLPASGRYCINQGDQYFGGASHDAREVFSWLWSSIYGVESWQANPWVWVIEFRRVEGGQRDRSAPIIRHQPHH